MAWTSPRTWVDTELVDSSLMNNHLRDNLNAVQDSLLGMIAYFSYDASSYGWLQCNGAAVSRTTYTLLWTRVSTGWAWGTGDGSTTFNVPNILGRSLVGSGLGSGLTTPRSIGGTGGAETHQLTASELAAHDHNMRFNSGTATAGFGASGYISGVDGGGIGHGHTTYNATTTNGLIVGGSPANAAHNNMHPWAGAWVGIFAGYGV